MKTSELRKKIFDFVKAKRKAIQRGDAMTKELTRIVHTVIPDADVFLRYVIFEFHVASPSRVDDIDQEGRIIPIETILGTVVPQHEFYFQSDIFLTEEEAEKLKIALWEKYRQ